LKKRKRKRKREKNKNKKAKREWEKRKVKDDKPARGSLYESSETVKKEESLHYGKGCEPTKN